jgi:hypothetical protein
MPVRRALPTLWISNEEYEVLDGLARDRAITVADLIKEVISPLVEGDGDGRVVVLRLPEHTWSSFAAFFEDETPECAMTRCLGADADDFGNALVAARGD